MTADADPIPNLPPPAAGPDGVPTAPATILIVDDTPENRDLLARQVGKLGHVAVEAEDGRLGIDLMRAGRFDLVLLDIMMPGLSGYDVLAMVKADVALRHVPVIVISALAEIESIVRCVELGAEDYLFKPFNSTLLRARVGACLEKKRLRDQERQILAALADEQRRGERLLLSIFPAAIARRLKDGETAIAEQFDAASVLWADLQDFPRLVAGKSAAETVAVLNRVYTEFDRLAERHGAEKIKTVGEAYMAAAGVPVRRANHAHAAAELALGMQQAAVRLDLGLREPLCLRIGISAGPVTAAVIGTARLAYDLWGPTVRLASQMESLGVPGGIQVDQSAYRLLAADYLFEDRGGFYVHGQGEVNTYLLIGRRRKG
jgi:adenylate cyclase